MEEKMTISFIILTASDSCFAGLAKDESGVELKRLIEDTKLFGAAKVNANVTVPDNLSQIRAAVLFFCDVVKVNVLLITGGTAIAPGDVNAEALSEWMEREVAGLSHSVLRDGFAKTPNAASSGVVAGVCKKTLIVSLPGNVDASVEGLKSIAAVLPNAVNLIITCKNNEVALTHGEKIVGQPKPKSKVSLKLTEENPVGNSTYPMKPMSELPDLFKKFVSPLDSVKIPSADAFGYVLAKNVISSENIPKHPTSMIDGYAITTLSSPIPRDYSYRKQIFIEYYNIIGEMTPDGRLQFYKSYTQKDFNDNGKGAIKISAGSPLPPETKYVIPFENTTASGIGEIYFSRSATPHGIREIGSDVCANQVVISTNELITQSVLGAIAAIGQKEISVFRKPVVAILSSGDELQEPWGPLKEYGVRDSNKIVLKSLISSWGYQVIDLGITPDEPDDVLNALQIGFASADVVITTGGMSMGYRDIIKDVLIQDLGMTIHFGRLQMRPGESTGFGTLNSPQRNVKYWFGLPGNPASAFVAAHLVVSPVLKMLSGWRSNIFQKKITAKAGHSIKKNCNAVIEYHRGSLSYFDIDGGVLEMPVFSTTGELNQRSSNILGCVNASCLLQIPAGKSYEKDDKIIVLLLE